MDKEQRRDIQLRRKYGITAAEYDQLFANQGGGCRICHRPPKKLPLSVDHDHNFKRVKIKLTRVAMPPVVGYPPSYQWEAKATYRSHDFSAHAFNRYEAHRDVRAQLKRASVRGLLCWLCNTGLRKFGHNIVRLTDAGLYLRRWQEDNNDPLPQRT